jgi:hypothetical protein
MMSFASVFLDLVRDESLWLCVGDTAEVPRGEYVFREFYCNEPRCDCRRVLLHVVSLTSRRVVASINYAFEPPEPPYEDEGQCFLDPLNPQTELGPAILRMFLGLLEADPSRHARFVRHYELWKSVVDDPSHPDHGKVRSVAHGDRSFRPAFLQMQPAQGARSKVGPNEPCPCGSGKKYKRCCRP